VTRALKVLLVEDSDLDAAHLQLELRRGGVAPAITRVQTREELARELPRENWDAVICDYALPQFSAPEALRMVQASGIDLPFIVVSGAIGEETAVEMMRAGAHDYLLKDRLTRLPAALDRHIRQAVERRARRHAEELFHVVLRSSPYPTGIIERSSGAIIAGSDSFRRTFLGNSHFPTPLKLTELIEFTQPERVTQLLTRGSGTAWYVIYRLGEIAHVGNIRCYSVEHDGASYACVVIEDVTEQHYLKAAFDAVPDPLLIISSEQRLLYANRPAEDLFGTLYFGSDVRTLLDRPQLERHWWQRPYGRYEATRLEFHDQPYEASSVPFRFAGETSTSTILTLRNVSQEEELLRLATHDALTGIYNMRYFEKALPGQLERVRDGAAASLAMFDLDHFKPINDELGHAAGDAALITFANLVRTELRPSDIFARLGGDEFAVFFPETTVDRARAILDAIYKRLARTLFRFDGTTRNFGASSGLASALPDDSPDSLRKRADVALYEAKREGRGRYVVA
jgi:diguanylate cyclase (GGDEF)-like protein